jgi:hypothetical protein
MDSGLCDSETQVFDHEFPPGDVAFPLPPT